jgi:hypothetical protein
LLEAMLRAFACLVSNAGSMLATVFNRNTRDWHTDETHEDQLQTSNDTCAAAFILRDDRRSASIPRDEAGGRPHRKQVPQTPLPPSPQSEGLAHSANRLEGLRRGPQSGRIGPGDQFEQRRARSAGRVHQSIPAHHAKRTACHPGSRAAAVRDPFVRIRDLQNGSRLALRWAGMTTMSTN